MSRRVPSSRALAASLGLSIAALVAAGPAIAEETAPPASAAKKKAPEFPSFESVSKDLTKVISTADGKPGLYTLHANHKDGRLLAELPKNFESQLIMIAPTVASGDEEAGVMGGSIYARWKRFGKHLALVEPNFVVRTTGDEQSKTSVKQLFTDRVILDVPIVAMGPGKGPVIDLQKLLLGQQAQFFGPRHGGYGPLVMKTRAHLASLKNAKAFPENIEITYEVPRADGRLVSLHYSVRVLPEKTTFKPRKADNRIGYFNVYYADLGQVGPEQPYTRYIARWRMEKADPKLKTSPPKEPIVWYIEHTTPIRYRRFVREGILEWNKAFESIGIVNAVEVYQQDASTGGHMEKDPEDARYNFFRWNESTQGYAIGPSRWDPRTGQILDADVVWHAGLTNAVVSMLRNLSGEIAVQGFTPETMAWLGEHPEWDPRLRLASPGMRARAAQHVHAEGHDHDAAEATEEVMRVPGLGGQWHACRIGDYLAMNIGLYVAVLDAGLHGGEDGVSSLDGLPEAFIGGMIKYISAHEVGHTMGLQHNFGASTIRSLADINSTEMSGKPTVGSVMEYSAVNINADDGEVQGAYATPTIGPYDYWAIAFGYGADDERDAVLARVAEPDHVFLNDIATIGPDPRAQVWDLGADSMNFAESRMRLVRDLRPRIVTDIVQDGESWRKARDRYEALLSNHMLSLVVASRWLGGSYTNWDHKGDPGDRDPVQSVETEKQRRALRFMMENAFEDEAFGLTPDLVARFGVQYWPDDPGSQSYFDDPSYEVHDLVSGVQAAALTMIMNPTKLRRLYDNEYRTLGEDDVITMAEVFGTVTDGIWRELDEPGGKRFGATDPMISSFRRNLQREHLERLIALSMPGRASSPSMRTISTLSAHTLRQLGEKIDAVDVELDPYTEAHLADISTRIQRALEAIYVYSAR